MANDQDMDQKLSLLFDLNPLPAIEWDLDFRVVAWNRAATQIFGYTKEEAIGRHAAELIISRELRTLVDNLFQSLLQQTGGSNSVNENITKTRETITCSWRNDPLVNNQGQVTGVLSIIQNVTAQKQTEEFLREQEEKIRQSEKRYQVLAEASPICVFYTDTQGNCTYTNDRWLDIAGLTQEEALGQGWSQNVHPDDKEQLFAEWGRSVATQQPFRFEYRFQLPDGAITWVISQAMGVKDEAKDGAVIGYVGTITNITDAKIAEAQLRESEKRFQALTEAKLLETQSFLESVLTNLPVAVFAKEAQDLNFILCNPAGEEVLKMKAEHILGKNDYDLFPPEQADVFARIDREALNSPEVIDIPEELAQDGRGMTRIFHTKKTAVLDGKGVPQSLLIITEDITERKAAEQQLQKKANQEELVNRINNKIRSSLDFNEILEKAVTEIHSFLNVDYCSVTKYLPPQENQVACWEVIAESKIPGIPDAPQKYPTSTVGVISERLLDLQIVKIDDTETCNDLEVKNILQLFGISSLTIIPSLLSNSLFVSFSCVNYQQPHQWLDEEVDLLEVVMEQLAIALNQSELYQKAESRAKELEEILKELGRTQGQLVQSEKMSSLGQLVAGVAHEINNPVNFIYGNLSHVSEYSQDLIRLLELYQKHYPQPVAEILEEAEAIDLEFLLGDMLPMLNSMKIGADRIKEIVLSLRNFSRTDEAGMKAVDIHGGINSTLMILQSRLKVKSNQPEIEVIKDYGDLPLVECYAGELNQVFMNILSNAIDALEERDRQRTFAECTQDPSYIQISTTTLIDEKESQVQIKIRDNGTGIPESVQQRLFDPFFTTKELGKGTGLGLSISYQVITERHNGSLTCESTLGVGTSFIIKIPQKNA